MARLSARERIVQISQTLFSEHGYRHTTTKMIAEAAGVNEVTVFRHFGTKEGIVKAIIESRATALAEIGRILGDDATGDLYVDLLRAAQTQFRYIQANLKLIITLLQESFGEAALIDFVSYLPRQVKEIIKSYFERMQAEGKMNPVDVEETAILFITPTFGLALMKGVFGDGVTSVTPKEQLERSVSLFVQSVHP